MMARLEFFRSVVLEESSLKGRSKTKLLVAPALIFEYKNNTELGIMLLIFPKRTINRASTVSIFRKFRKYIFTFYS